MKRLQPALDRAKGTPAWHHYNDLYNEVVATYRHNELLCEAGYTELPGYDPDAWRQLAVGLGLGTDPVEPHKVTATLVGRARVERMAQGWGTGEGRGSKPKAKRKKLAPPPRRNGERDAWVDRCRRKKPPMSWEDIYDEGVKLAKTKGWNMPNSWKGLSEANRRYLAHLRKLRNARKASTKA